MKKAIIMFVALSFGFVAQAASNELTVNNYSDSDVDVYFMALGCVKWPDDDLWTVCSKETLAPGANLKYSFPGGTSAQEILIRPTAITKMVNENWDMNPAWGSFAKDWAMAFKKVATEGPKGVLSFLKIFTDLFNIKKKIDITHKLAYWNANIWGRGNTTFNFDQSEANKIKKNFEIMLADKKKAEEQK